jgi:Rieske Fe-S protein
MKPPLGEAGRPAVESASSVPKGEGRILDQGAAKVAVYRDDEGVVHAVSAVCTHRGCIVEWNATDRSWDCPCHGARYAPSGRVLRGPAREDLAAVDLLEQPS